MIVTTTPSVEGRRITEYKGVVFGEVIAGVNFVKDFVAGLSNFFGGRSGTYGGAHQRPPAGPGRNGAAGGSAGRRCRGGCGH